MRTTRSLLNFAAMFERFFRCTKALSTSPLSKAWDMESQHCWFGHAIAIESLKSVDFDLAIFEKNCRAISAGALQTMHWMDFTSKFLDTVTVRGRRIYRPYSYVCQWFVFLQSVATAKSKIIKISIAYNWRILDQHPEHSPKPGLLPKRCKGHVEKKRWIFDDFFRIAALHAGQAHLELRSLDEARQSSWSRHAGQSIT